MSEGDENELLTEASKVFQWRCTATISHKTYIEMNSVHPMVADIASFPRARINHLTPRTLDIDLVQETMERRGLPTKERIEGPLRRECSILLRRKISKALEEQVKFVDDEGKITVGHHIARFGEVEQRGAAVTDKGRKLYDMLLEKTSDIAKNNFTTEEEYQQILRDNFADYADT